MLVSLTPEFLATQLVCPPGKTRFEFVDKDGVKGLYVEVRPKSPGEGTYYFRYKDTHGKTCHQRLGGTRDMALAEARAAAKKLKAQITLGADPRAEAKARKNVLTLDQFWTDHYLPQAMKSKRSWTRDAQMMRLRIQPEFGHKRLTEITRQQIEAFHTRLAEEGLAPAHCDLYLKLLRTLMGRAELYGYIKESPARRLRLFNPDNRVENYLTPQQLETLLAALRSDANQSVCQIILFMLATGVRLRVALNARYTDLNREQRLLKIPASSSKSRKVAHVPLSDAAMEVINGLDTEGRYEYLFVSKRTGKPFTTITKQWHRIRAKAGLKFLRLHDMRHNLAALLANSGRTLLEIQQVLQHADSRMTLRYIRLTNSTLLAAVNSAAPMLMRGAQSDDRVAGEPRPAPASLNGGEKPAA